VRPARLIGQTGGLSTKRNVNACVGAELCSPLFDWFRRKKPDLESLGGSERQFLMPIYVISLHT
jgi:hypothetical protein